MTNSSWMPISFLALFLLPMLLDAFSIGPTTTRTTMTTTTTQSRSHSFVPITCRRRLDAGHCRRLGRLSVSRRRDDDDLPALEDDDDDNNNNNNHMAVVRALQASFYQTSSYLPAPSLDTATGQFHYLPLWRVGWPEVPGRSNILHVHEGTYTNMFETLLHTPPPWYFGHLYLHGGSKELAQTPLVAWHNFDPSTAPHYDIVGCLMRLVDYRRLADGRLILLVQAVERMVVHHVEQSLPYSVAHVQILPDQEEYHHDDDDDTLSLWTATATTRDQQAFQRDNNNDDNNIDDDDDDDSETVRRSQAIDTALQHWHRYEFAEAVLPLPWQADDLDPSVVATMRPADLAPLLPLAFFSSVVNVTQLLRTMKQEQQQESVSSSSADWSLLDDHDDDDDALLSSSSFLGASPTDDELIRRGVLSEPTTTTTTTFSSSSNMSSSSLLAATTSADLLECELWTFLHEMVTTNPAAVVVPWALLALLPPPPTPWPLFEHIVHRRIITNNNNATTTTGTASSSSSSTNNNNNNGRDAEEQSPLQPLERLQPVHPSYPPARRQKRLSYTAAVMLEDSYNSHALRRQLLRLPTTQERLAFVLHNLQTRFGAFQ